MRRRLKRKRYAERHRQTSSSPEGQSAGVRRTGHVSPPRHLPEQSPSSSGTNTRFPAVPVATSGAELATPEPEPHDDRFEATVKVSSAAHDAPDTAADADVRPTAVPESVTDSSVLDADDTDAVATDDLLEPPPTVTLIHDDDFSRCECPGLYCRRGTHPYCSACHKTSYDDPCVHLRDFAEGLDFEC
jgi:hypothetical protein